MKLGRIQPADRAFEDILNELDGLITAQRCRPSHF